MEIVPSRWHSLGLLGLDLGLASSSIGPFGLRATGSEKILTESGIDPPNQRCRRVKCGIAAGDPSHYSPSPQCIRGELGEGVHNRPHVVCGILISLQTIPTPVLQAVLPCQPLVLAGV